MPDAPNIFPALRYRDARAGIEWLQRALGFDVVSVHEHDGVIVHAELGLGPGMIMLGSAGAGDTRLDRGVGAASVYFVPDDVAALYERATEAGATVLRELQDTDYGSREFTVEDPEGNRWSAGSYMPER